MKADFKPFDQSETFDEAYPTRPTLRIGREKATLTFEPFTEHNKSMTCRVDVFGANPRVIRLNSAEARELFDHLLKQFNFYF